MLVQAAPRGAGWGGVAFCAPWKRGHPRLEFHLGSWHRDTFVMRGPASAAAGERVKRTADSQEGAPQLQSFAEKLNLNEQLRAQRV